MAFELIEFKLECLEGLSFANMSEILRLNNIFMKYWDWILMYLIVATEETK